MTKIIGFIRNIDKSFSSKGGRFIVEIENDEDIEKITIGDCTIIQTFTDPKALTDEAKNELFK